MNLKPKPATGFLLVCLFLGYGIYALRHLEPGFTFAKYDPGWMVTTVISLVADGDLDLRNQLHNNPDEAADQTSQGLAGQWYPEHEYLMAIATVPFFLLLGIWGCLAFNVLISILTLVMVYNLCCRHVDPKSALIAVAFTAFASAFQDYIYSYSVDVFGAFLLVAAYRIVLGQRTVLSGFMWGLSVFGRFANAVTAPAFIVFLLLNETGAGADATSPQSVFSKRWAHRLLRFSLGVLPVIACLGWANWKMFGSPLNISYSRWQHFERGFATVSSQTHAFTASLIHGLPAILFDTKQGLFYCAPLLIVALAFGMRPFWRRSNNEAILFGLVCVSFIVFFSKYFFWAAGGGIRYLLPVIALGTIPLSFAVKAALAADKKECQERK